MAAPEQLVEWLTGYVFRDRKEKLPPGMLLQYHSRSDEHSKKLGELIIDDLLAACESLRRQAAQGDVACGINVLHKWPNGKTKTLDLAIGIPRSRQIPPTAKERINRLTGSRSDAPFSRVLVACEEKATMTEHGKSQPRIYSELNDAHTIVHQGGRDTIAAGITMLNISDTFISPLRQTREQTAPYITKHRQPDVTFSMVQHLRKLPIRDSIDAVGLDSYCTLVISLDNQGHVSLHTDPPAPQPGDRDEYGTFITRIAQLYEERYGDIDHLPQVGGLTIEESLIKLAIAHPGLLHQAGQLIAADGRPGGDELEALLSSLDSLPPPADQ